MTHRDRICRAPRSRLASSLFLAGCLLLFGFLIRGCASQPLMPWHTESLTAEFTARQTDEVRNFEDYLQLEDRLFAELEEKIVAGIETGPAQALVRFSEGSFANPKSRPFNWNRSFEFPAAAPVGGVLLLHGMTDSPYSLRALGESLHRRDYWVLGLRLPGHGTAPSGLLRVKWEDMAAAVRLGVDRLATQVGDRPIHIIGYSNGAPLALDFALDALEGRASPVPASLVLISPAVGLRPLAAFAGWKRRLSVLPGFSGLGWLLVEPEFDPFKYNSFTTNGSEQVHRLTQSVAARIRGLTDSSAGAFPPTLVFKSNADATVSTEALVTQLLIPLDSAHHELVLFDINRSAAKTSLMIYDPAALSTRVMGNDTLPFAVTLVTNENPDSPAAVARRQPPFSAEVTDTEPLGLAWPPAVISLSHVALPFPPDDPLYGQRPPDNEDLLFLGQTGLQGERGLLLIPADWLMRMRHNPFYAYLETSALDWMQHTGQQHHAPLRGQ
jgi:pimeloyl-ACP methyl ester carboxylesterase